MICLAQKEYALQIAKIHKQEIGSGFLSSLNIRFLENLYTAMIESDSSFCVVAKENDHIVGFISGVIDINAFYRYFIKRYFFHSAILLFKKIFSISYMKKVMETLRYPTKEQGLLSAELLTMAVSKQFQGRGIAGKMFLEFLVQMKKRNIASFKVLVGEELTPAIHFYEKHGFKFLKKVTLHGNAVSRVYIYNL